MVLVRVRDHKQVDVRFRFVEDGPDLRSDMGEIATVCAVDQDPASVDLDQQRVRELLVADVQQMDSKITIHVPIPLRQAG